jgi:4-aminobutyrate aminotransferase-like enzyme
MQQGVVPDIVTMGKPFGNGMPLAAVVCTQEVADSFSNGGLEYFNTFGGNPVACAAGLACMGVVEEEGLQEHAKEVGRYIRKRVTELGARLEEQNNSCGSTPGSCISIGDVRGSGLFIGIELVRNRRTLEPATAETSVLCSRLKDEYQILTSIDGPHDNVLVSGLQVNKAN